MSLGSLRQKLRKYMRENMADDIAKFDPEAEDESGEEDEEKDEDEDSDDEGRPRGKSEEKEVRKKSRATLDDGSDSDSDDWGDSDSDSDSSSDDGLGAGVTYTREMFLKKAEDPEKEAKKKEKKDAKDEKREIAKQEQIRKKKLREEEDEESDASGDEGEGWTKVSKVSKIAMFAADAEITIELVIKKLNEIMAARGKKKTNRKEQIELLNELAKIAREHNLGPGVHIKIKFSIIAALFDYNPKLSDAMKPDSWEKCIEGVDSLLDLLEEHADKITIGALITDENEVFDVEPYKVRGCFLTSVEKLNEEFIKVLKACDAHSNEYVERLKDEPRIVQILDKGEAMVKKSGSPSEICRIYLKRIEHIYFKFDPVFIEQKQGKVDASVETSVKKMDELCKYIYSKDSTDRLRARAILCHIYHHAIHDNWYEARDLMLMSHLQDSVHHSDPSTQILYNRTMVQLGLCGFRHATIKDAHNALLDT